MRVLFLITDNCWSGSARAFVAAGQGLAARGHQVTLACESDCPVQVRAGEAELPVVLLEPDASAAGNTWQVRSALQGKDVDVVFVHSDSELMIASSASKLGGRAGAIIRRVPPFTMLNPGRAARLATRMANTGFLFSTEVDREAAQASGMRGRSAVATLGIDLARHENVKAATRSSIGAPPTSRLIVCVNDGSGKHRVLTALRTIALLAPRHPDLHLAIVGEGRVDELRMHGAALGVGPMISYLGVRDDELSIIRAAEVGWIAADGDAAAFAALDFMAFRIPVIAERTPITEHYVADGIAGILLAPEDPPMTASAVAAFLAKDDQRAAMGKAGRARLQRDFTYDAMIRGFEQAVGAPAPRAAQPA